MEPAARDGDGDKGGGGEPKNPGASAAARSGEADSMGRNAALLSAGTLASRLLGMLRETLIAATFDLAATDAFFVAWRIPNALRAMLAEGAARYVFNPVLSDALNAGGAGTPKDVPAMRRALASVRGAALLVMLAVTALGVLFARPIFALVSGGFDGDAARFELGVGVLRVLFPFIFFMGWFAVGNSALQLLDRFAPGAFAPVMLNVAFVTVPYALVPVLARFDVHPIYGLAGAALVGGALQVLWLRPALRRLDLLPRPRLAWDATTREMRRIFGPQLAGQAIYQVNVVVAGRFLGELPRGAASFFSYAQRLADIPQGLFAVALSGAAARAMQADATRHNHEQVARIYERSLRMAAFVALPFCVILATYAEAIIPLVYGYGRFARLGGAAVAEVAASLRWQAVGVAFLAFVQQTTAVFGVYKRRGALLGAAALSLATFWAVARATSGEMGHRGVAAATALSSGAQLAALLVLVRTLVPVRFGEVGPTLAKVLFATGVTALAARAAVLYLPVTGPSLGAKVLAVVGGAALLAVHGLVTWVLRCEETIALRDKVAARLRRRRGRG